jgi:hypothetical protein
MNDNENVRATRIALVTLRRMVIPPEELAKLSAFYFKERKGEVIQRPDALSDAPYDAVTWREHQRYGIMRPFPFRNICMFIGILRDL